MPNYKAYPTVANTPNRKMRKSQRGSTFAHNKAQGRVERNARRDARKENTNVKI